jgi:hypothetical protein
VEVASPVVVAEEAAAAAGEFLGRSEKPSSNPYRDKDDHSSRPGRELTLSSTSLEASGPLRVGFVHVAAAATTATCWYVTRSTAKGPELPPGAGLAGQVAHCPKNRRKAAAAIVSGLPYVCAESWFSPGNRRTVECGSTVCRRRRSSLTIDAGVVG